MFFSFLNSNRVSILKIQKNKKYHYKYIVDKTFFIYKVVITDHMGVVRQNVNTRYNNKDACRPTWVKTRSVFRYVGGGAETFFPSKNPQFKEMS